MMLYYSSRQASGQLRVALGEREALKDEVTNKEPAYDIYYNIYIYIHMYTYIHIYIYIYTYGKERKAARPARADARAPSACESSRQVWPPFFSERGSGDGHPQRYTIIIIIYTYIHIYIYIYKSYPCLNLTVSAVQFATRGCFDGILLGILKDEVTKKEPT